MDSAVFFDVAAEGLQPISWSSARAGLPSGWWGHVPFAHWLVSVSKPRLIVELGTHRGVSYSAFCEAVARCGLSTRCVAVDTWQGDEHAGYYADELFVEFSRFHDARYSRFSSLIRDTFDNAVGLFEDESIDLLHIDGLHTYEAVKHDFKTWRPKLSPNAVVLLHDTNVRTGDFGVWRLWDELSDAFETIDFPHSNGLGVIQLGDGALPIKRLVGGTPEEKARAQAFFEFAGGALTGNQQNCELSAQLEALRIDRASAQDIMEKQAVDLAGLHSRFDALLADRTAAQEVIEHLSRELVTARDVISHQQSDIAHFAEALKQLERKWLIRLARKVGVLRAEAPP